MNIRKTTSPLRTSLFTAIVLISTAVTAGNQTGAELQQFTMRRQTDAWQFGIQDCAKCDTRWYRILPDTKFFVDGKAVTRGMALVFNKEESYAVLDEESGTLLELHISRQSGKRSMQ